MRIFAERELQYVLEAQLQELRKEVHSEDKNRLLGRMGRLPGNDTIDQHRRANPRILLRGLQRRQSAE